MRTFRDLIASSVVSLVLGIMFACSPISGQQAAQAGGGHDSADKSYFPLATGNFWIYRCSVEGEHQFDKTVKLMSVVTHQGLRFFRAELRVSVQADPLVFFYYKDADGNVFVAPGASREDSEMIITAAPKAGEKVSKLMVVGTESLSIPAVGAVQALRLENFSLDDPTIPEERRMEWLGRFYARGIGLVAEGDGLGGECVLQKYQLEH